MQVKVYAPAFLDHKSIDSTGMMEIPPGSTLAEVYKKLKAPLIIWPVLLSSINYEKAALNRTLNDGDVVSIYFPLSGG